MELYFYDGTPYLIVRASIWKKSGITMSKFADLLQKYLEKDYNKETGYFEIEDCKEITHYSDSAGFHRLWAITLCQSLAEQEEATIEIRRAYDRVYKKYIGE